MPRRKKCLIHFACAEVIVLGSGLKRLERGIQKYELKFVKSADRRLAATYEHPHCRRHPHFNQGKCMNPERKEILNLISLPGRMNAAEAAWRLGFEPDHIPILVSAGQLKPLGNPPPGAVKFFLTAEIEQKKGDARWMNKATELIRLKVKDKNERAAKSRTLKGSVSTTNGNATNGNNSRDRHS